MIGILLCLALAVASFAFENYNEKLRQLDECDNEFGVSTLKYVEKINELCFGNGLEIVQCTEFEDHYSTNVVALSAKTMYSNSLASLAIVSHELGHARQDCSGNKLKKHWRNRRIGRFLGMLFMPLLLAGAVLSLLWVFSVLPEMLYLILGLSFVGLSLLIFVFALVLKSNEIKIEKEASVFAEEFLKQILNEKELKSCREFLNSARLTYWASLLRTMLSWTMLTKKDVMFR